MSRKAIKGPHSTGKSVMTEYVVLVDEQDNEIGVAEKLTAHQNNLLHRAFSVFIYRNHAEIEILLQQRAMHKYHSAGLWTNTCCSHPQPGEAILAAGQRRLQEELGLVSSLQQIGSFTYNAHFSNGLSEYELDHVLVGEVPVECSVEPNPDEVLATRWIKLDQLTHELAANPAHFTPWLPPAFNLIKKYFNSQS